MTDRELTIYRVSGTERRTLDTPAEYAAVLREIFRIELTKAEAAQLPLFA
jgi:N-hydroxyarylamine O-acetyltransferase